MPLLSEQTIQAVRELHIEDIISPYVELKKNTGYSPFTEEKTPSFHINPSKNYFKCFSTGIGGDGIKFIIELKKLSFSEAITYLAKAHNIHIEYADFNPEQEAAFKEEQKRRESLKAALSFALKYFCGQKIPVNWSKFRKFKQEDFDLFQVGYASEKWEGLYEKAKEFFSDEVLNEAGLITKSSKGNYIDRFRERIIFPIFDKYGQVVAFSGRHKLTLSDTEKEKAKKEGAFIPPKYLNSPDSTWTKGDHLYGLHLAIKAITKEGFAYFVEGNTDVMRFHQWELSNTVAPCGTALTEKQILLLKKYTDSVCIVPDKDTAGAKALHKNAEMFIKKGFNVKVLLPDGKLDPDEHLKKILSSEKVEAWLNETQDYFIYRADIADIIPKEDAKEKAEAIIELGRLVELIPNEILRETTYDAISNTYSDFKKKYKLKKREKKKEFEYADLEEVEQEEAHNYHFYEKDNKMYSGKEISTFIMRYLYYIETKDIPKIIVYFKNFLNDNSTLAMTTDELSSATDLKKITSRIDGVFVWKGKQENLDDVNTKLRQGLTKAKIPEYLGYNFDEEHQFGFYVWANGIQFHNAFFEPDNMGVVTLRHEIDSLESFTKMPNKRKYEVEGRIEYIDDIKDFIHNKGQSKVSDMIRTKGLRKLTHHYLPYLKKNLSDTSKFYKFEKYFKYVPNKQINFNTWTKKLIAVYGDTGMFMICYYLMCLYRDVVFKENQSYISLINFYAPPGKGKSTAARSLMRMWGANHGEEEGRDINDDTKRGILDYVSIFQNACIWINEFDRTFKSQREAKIAMLKKFAGGSERAVGRSANSGDESQQNNNGTIISGQDSTASVADPGLDDRCLSFFFDGKDQNEDAFRDLTWFQEKGYCTQITFDLLNDKYRQLIQERIRNTKKEISEILNAKLREELEQKKIPSMPDKRILLNSISILLPYWVLRKNTDLNFNFDHDVFLDRVMDNIKKKISIKQTTNEVAQFFSIISTLGSWYNYYFKVQKEGDGKSKVFLRLRAMMGEYRKACRVQGEIPFKENDLKDMLLMHKSALTPDGTSPAYKLGLRSSKVDFPAANKFNTSAIVLDYETLQAEGIDLPTTERVDDVDSVDDNSNTVNKPLNVTSPIAEQGNLPFG